MNGDENHCSSLVNHRLGLEQTWLVFRLADAFLGNEDRHTLRDPVAGTQFIEDLLEPVGVPEWESLR